MMGLIDKNLRAGWITWQVMAGVIAISAVSGLVIRSSAAYAIAIFAMGGGISAHFLALFHRNDDANWQKLEAIMPIKTAHVELSRYISFLIIFLLICVVGATYTLTNYFTGVLIDACFSRDCNCVCECTLTYGVMSTFAAAATLFFLMGAIIFPAIRWASLKKIEVVTSISYGLGLGVFFGVSFLQGRLDFLPINLQAIAAGLMFALFIGSYFLSLHIYKKKLKGNGVLQ